MVDDFLAFFAEVVFAGETLVSYAFDDLFCAPSAWNFVDDFLLFDDWLLITCLLFYLFWVWIRKKTRVLDSDLLF
jgi:hypothetical protein